MGTKFSESAKIIKHDDGKVEFVNTEWPNLIELRNVEQSYDGGKTFIIKDFNFLLEDKPSQGQFNVILGKSGCGKSTILRYISGLQIPTAGEILINDKPREPNYPISQVFQSYSSLEWYTVLKNVMLPLEFQGVKGSEAEDRAGEMLKKVGLSGHERKFAQYPILSGGQLQRVAIARSLISNPQFLLMDEPFGALDTFTRTQMQELVQSIWLESSMTVIFVTHDIPESVFLGDDIYIMDANPGRIMDHVHIELPLDRSREIKTSHEFVDYARYIESILMK